MCMLVLRSVRILEGVNFRKLNKINIYQRKQNRKSTALLSLHDRYHWTSLGKRRDQLPKSRVAVWKRPSVRSCGKNRPLKLTCQKRNQEKQYPELSFLQFSILLHISPVGQIQQCKVQKSSLIQTTVFVSWYK